jgi:UPF0271 protein
MTAPFSVDLNCDLGESFGACGFHAGDPAVMKKTVRLALQQQVAVGAHPGLPDLVGFGRREIAVSPEEAFDMTVYQLGALAAFVKAEGGTLHHVKPHGALYNMAAVTPALAEAIAEAVYRVNPELLLYGLAGSALIQAGQKLGLRTVNEVFADRTYQPDGTLTSRRSPNALLSDPQEAIQQVVRMVKEGKVRSQPGPDVAIQADTVCIHGDGAHALAFARRIREVLEREGVMVQAPLGESIA